MKTFEEVKAIAEDPTVSDIDAVGAIWDFLSALYPEMVKKD